jgi:hypothetical protein
MVGVEKDWVSSDKSTLPRKIYKDPDKWYPLYIILTYLYYLADPQVQKRNIT